MAAIEPPKKLAVTPGKSMSEELSMQLKLLKKTDGKIQESLR